MTGTRAIGHVQLFSRSVGEPVQWRMLSGNNREIGRGVDSYPDTESARLGVKELQSLLEALEAGVRRNTSNEWVWHLSLEGRLVAVSGHGFNRLIRCEQGLTQFQATIRVAEVGPALMVSDSRRW